MSLESEILTTLINIYERSKVSKGQNKVHKDIKLDITNSVFDKHRNNDNGELELALKRIERDGYVTSSYTRNGQFQCLILNLDEQSIDRAYKYLKRNNPKNIIAEYINLFSVTKQGCQIVKDFSQKMINLLEAKKLSTVQTYISSKEEVLDICKAINEMSTLEEDVQERIFCAKLFSNSKRFNELRWKISKIIREFSDEPFDDEDDVIASMGVIRNTTYAFIKGNLVVKLNSQIIDLKEYKEPLALSDSGIKNIEILETNAKTLFTVENLTSFDVFEKNDSIVIYLGGFHNKVKRELIKKIASVGLITEFYHYGDIDAGGFYILNHLKEKTSIGFKPYMMGIKELEKYNKYCKDLTVNDKNRLNKMMENSRFFEFRNVIKYMLKNNVKLEQEAID